jgi:very-short-patch-repair endonuclease
VVRCLRTEGVKVIRVWEHELEKHSRRISRILGELRQAQGSF